MDNFLRQFRFNPGLHKAIGVEREFFLESNDGNLIPMAPEFLGHMEDPSWTHELSACIVEHRSTPHTNLKLLRRELNNSLKIGQQIARDLNLSLRVSPVAPKDMPLDVFPLERYQAIKQQLEPEILAAACQVAGVHFHLGVSNWTEALSVYKRLCQNLDNLLSLGNNSTGERMRLYAKVAPLWQPMNLESVEDLHNLAAHQGFLQNPRDWWQVIRISIHGTVEVRTFDMTEDTDHIIEWAKQVHSIAFR